MFKGIAFALAACFLWGLIFVVPQFLEGFTSVEIALGRYFFYGIISLGILGKTRCRYPANIWGKALYFSLISTMVYYTALVFALRCCNPAICALILGTSPITIALYGNWKEKECNYKSLFFPSLLILLGVVLVNFPHIKAADSLSNYILGLACCLVSLFAWSWYVVANTKFFREHPEVASNDWSTMIGVLALFWVTLFGFGFQLTGHFQIEKYLTVNDDLVRFAIGCGVLGLFCSWMGSYFWNRASHYLPVTLAGQLTIFETVFGIIFVFTLSQTFPSLIEVIGIFVLLGSVGYSIQLFSQISSQKTIA